MEIHSPHSELSKYQYFYAIPMLILCIFPLTVQSLMESTSFSFTSFTSGMPDINFEGDAYASEPIIELTKSLENMSVSSIGRVTYGKPIHLWDKSTGHLADFSIHFSCVINSLGNFTKADGIAAFLVPTGSYIPTLSGGGYLGLYSDYMKPNFFAVELDTISNEWDPKDVRDHVGIDIDSVVSAKTVNWSLNDIENGGRIDVSIHYNSSSKNLSVSVTNGDYKTYAGIHTYNLNLIVDLRDYLPEWVTVGLSGTTTRLYFEKNQVYSWAFSSNLEVHSKSGGLPWFLWVAIGTVALCLAAGAFYGFYYFYWKPPIAGKGKFEEDSGPKKFTFKSLVAATNKFRKEIGRGGFGKVYEGLLLETNTRIAVKRITFRSPSLGFKDYESEIKTIGQLRHRNLVQLKGWCREKQGWFCFEQEVLLLVYEFLVEKSLDLHLFNQARLLTWDQRRRIVSGLATALRYMQEECNPYVVHRDIKSANVLLDSELNPKLSDFGQARLVEHGNAARTTDLIGTEGYISPEYRQSQKPTKESDVYSFGIVALEIACGKRAVFQGQRDGRNSEVKLVGWVWEQYGRGDNEDPIPAVADPRLNGAYVLEEMRRLVVVGLACAHPSDSNRPSIKEAIDMLEGKIQLPTLPPQMPVPPQIAELRAIAFSTSGPPSQVGSPPHIGTSQLPRTQSLEYNTAPSNAP